MKNPFAYLPLLALLACAQPETVSQSESLLMDAANARSQAAGYLRDAEAARTTEESDLLKRHAQESEAWAESLEQRAEDYASEGL